METGNRKFHNFIWSLVLCISIVTGAAAPAYADTTTTSYNYYGITLGDGTTGITNLNSADMLGYVLSVLSSNQKAIYNKISSSGGSDYSNVLNSILGHLSDINNKITAAVVTGTDKLFFIGDTLSYINRPVWSDGDSIAEQLQAYMSAMSYNLVSVYNKIDDVKTDTANLSGIKTDTVNLSGIKTDTANLSGIKTNSDYLPGIKTDTASINTKLQQIDTDLNSFKTANHTDITVFQDDYNNINWISQGAYNGIKTSLTDNYIASNTQSKDFYILFSSGNSDVFRVETPIGGATLNSNTSFEYGYIYNNRFYKVDCSLIAESSSLRTTDFYIYIPYRFNNPSSYQSAIHVVSDSNFNLYTSTGFIYGIDNSENDYYTVTDNILLFNINYLFRQAKEVFFDDKTIQAKKNNQAQENSVLDNFTGSGSASATVSDFGAVKDSIVDLKGGFSGGASSAETFTFLAGDSNAWDWFTQETADSLDNTQGSNNRLMRGSGSLASDTPLLDSYYNDIMSILGVN